jgi:hypothetical protein
MISDHYHTAAADVSRVTAAQRGPARRLAAPAALPPTDLSGGLNGDTGEVFAEDARTDAAAAVDTR